MKGPQITAEKLGEWIAQEFKHWKKELPQLSADGEEAIMRFNNGSGEIIVSCSKQKTYVENLQCLYIGIRQVRLNEKRGLISMMEIIYSK